MSVERLLSARAYVLHVHQRDLRAVLSRPLIIEWPPLTRTYDALLCWPPVMFAPSRRSLSDVSLTVATEDYERPTAAGVVWVNA